MEVDGLRQVQGRIGGGIEVGVVLVEVVVVARGLVGRGAQADAEVVFPAKRIEQVAVDKTGVVAPGVVLVVVDAAAGDLKGTAVALEGGTRRDIDDTADGVAVAVGRGGLDHLDVRDAVGVELAGAEAAAGAGSRDAVPVDLEGVILGFQTADVHAVGGAVFGFVDGQAGQALEGVADVAADHGAEGFFGHDIHDAFGGLLLIDGLSLAAGLLGDGEGLHLQRRAGEACRDRDRRVGGDRHVLHERIETDVVDLQLIGTHRNGRQIETALGIRGIGGRGAEHTHDRALEGLARRVIGDAAGDRTGLGGLGEGPARTESGENREAAGAEARREGVSKRRFVGVHLSRDREFPASRLVRLAGAIRAETSPRLCPLIVASSWRIADEWVSISCRPRGEPVTTKISRIWDFDTFASALVCKRWRERNYRSSPHMMRPMRTRIAAGRFPGGSVQDAMKRQAPHLRGAKPVRRAGGGKLRSISGAFGALAPYGVGFAISTA